MVLCTALSLAHSLNRSYIRLTADRLSRRLTPFADVVLKSRELRDIYTSVDYDVLQIDGVQIVAKLSKALGKRKRAASIEQSNLIRTIIVNFD